MQWELAQYTLLRITTRACLGDHMPAFQAFQFLDQNIVGNIHASHKATGGLQRLQKGPRLPTELDQLRTLQQQLSGTIFHLL